MTSMFTVLLRCPWSNHPRCGRPVFLRGLPLLQKYVSSSACTFMGRLKSKAPSCCSIVSFLKPTRLSLYLPDRPSRVICTLRFSIMSMLPRSRRNTIPDLRSSMPRSFSCPFRNCLFLRLPERVTWKLRMSIWFASRVSLPLEGADKISHLKSVLLMDASLMSIYTLKGLFFFFSFLSFFFDRASTTN